MYMSKMERTLNVGVANRRSLFRKSAKGLLICLERRADEKKIQRDGGKSVGEK